MTDQLRRSSEPGVSAPATSRSGCNGMHTIGAKRRPPRTRPECAARCVFFRTQCGIARAPDVSCARTCALAQLPRVHHGEARSSDTADHAAVAECAQRAHDDLARRTEQVGERRLAHPEIELL